MLEFDVNKTFRSRSRTVKVACTGNVNANELTALYGQSGIGKTSVLRMLAGLLKPDAGRIKDGEKVWFDSATNLKPFHRNVAMVFQDYNLFPNMTLEDNIKYAADNQHKASWLNYARELKMENLLNAYPAQLSGGQRQRGALLRALAQKTEVLLLDEPFSALDDETSEALLEMLNREMDERKLFVLFVTHRKDILLSRAHKIIEMMPGSITKTGIPQEILTRIF